MLSDWMPTLKAKLTEITELLQVHTMDELPATIMVFPSAIITTIGGAFEYSTGGPCLDYHDIQITIFLAPQILPEAYAVAIPLIAKVRDKLAANMKLNGLVDHILPVESRSYEGPGSVRYGDKDLLGIIFRYTVKDDETGTYTVSA